VQCICITL